MTKYLIIWDWNNTLVSTLQASFLALRDVSEKYGTPAVSHDEVMSVIGTHRDYWRQMFGAREEEAVAFYLNRYAAYQNTVTVIDGAKEVLEYVKSRHIPQIILSNEWIKLLSGETICTGLAPYFDKIQGTVDSHGKPELSFADQALKGFSYDHLILIGDGISDMQMAKVLQATSIAVFDYIPATIKTDYRCRDLFEVKKTLQSLLENE